MLKHFQNAPANQTLYSNLSRNPYSTYCNVGLEPVTPSGWLETGPEAGTLEVNSVSRSFLFGAVCAALAPEPSTGRDFDSDVAKNPVGPKTQRQFNASVTELSLYRVQDKTIE